MKRIETNVFRHHPLSYLTAAALGVAAGLLVAFFSRFPHDDLWSLALFSSQCIGFWCCACSLIALFSSRQTAAGAHVALFVFWMFYVTGVFKRLATVRRGYSPVSYFYSGLWQELAYGLLPAAGCFAAAMILWYGRRSRMPFVLLRFAPPAVIAAEAVMLWCIVCFRRQGLFMALVDTGCVFLYAAVIRRASGSRAKSDRMRGEGEICTHAENGSS